MKIFFIGGGEINLKETLKIDKEVIKEGGGKSAKVLFFPTAAGDSDVYIKGFLDYYSSLGCKNIQSAKISTENINDIKKKITDSDIIYLGGGSTKLLISEFRKNNIIDYIKTFLKNGKVLAGMSAGASALGKTSIVSEIDKEIETKKGLGFIENLMFLPHYSEKHKQKAIQLKSKFPDSRIFLLPEKTALYLKDQRFKKIGKVYEK